MVIPGYAGTLSIPRDRLTALITGASTGIGYDLARLMAPDFDLILVARSRDRLENLRHELQAKYRTQIHNMPPDLSRPEAPEGLFAEIAPRGFKASALINTTAFYPYALLLYTHLHHQPHM